jgi:glycosyltransferase involved in cell wall biosynthesis
VWIRERDCTFIQNKAMPFLSVVIPTYNRKESLLRTLEALKQQTLPVERFEVIVVSDGSTDGTGEAVRTRTYPFRLRFMEQPNSGPSVARNLGARAACGEVIVFIDDDIEPSPAFLQVHAKAHEADPCLVLIGPQSMPKGEWFPVWIAWEHQMLECQYARFRSGEWKAGPNNLYSGNFSVRRRHLIDVGGFDEKFVRQEDVELGFRLAAHSLRFRFEPAAQAFHRPERTFESWYKTPYVYGIRDVQMARNKGQAYALHLARKHYRERNLFTRMCARICIGRPVLEPLALWLLKPLLLLTDRAGVRWLSMRLCSLLFNLRYLQGMAHEMGGARKMWEAMRGKSGNDA